MAADVPKDWTYVQAATTAYAVERISLLRIGQQFRSMIIQENDVKLFRAIRLSRLAWAAVKRIVTTQRLTGADCG
jgi:hypothetical protein